MALALAGVLMVFAALWLDLDPGSLLVLAVLGGVLAWRCLSLGLGGRPWSLSRGGLLGAGLALLSGWALAILAPTPGRMGTAATALAALLAAGIALSSWARPRPTGLDPRPGDDLLPLLAGLAFYAALLPLRFWARDHFALPASDGLNLFYMPRMAYEGIPGAPFERPGLVLWPLGWWELTLLAGAWAWRAPSWGRLALVTGLGFVGKLALAALSSTGLAVLPQKITAVSTAYFYLAIAADKVGVWNFVRHFNQIQQSLHTHGQSHPFGPELVYWLLLAGHPPSPWVPALALGLLTSLIPLFLAAILVELGKPLRWGLAVLLLYVAAPPSALLASSGIDSTLSLIFVSSAWAALRGANTGRGRWLLLAGLGVFAGTLISSATAYLVLALGFAAAAGVLTGGLAWRSLPRLAAWILAPALLLNLALSLATDNGFNLLGVYAYAARYQVFAVGRPWLLWSWLNPLLFLGYAGAGTLGLAFSAGAARLNGRRRLGGAGLVALALLVAAWMQGLGLGEAQRIFHWGYAGLALLALDAPGQDPDGDGAYLRWALWASLNALTSMVLEMTVMHYW
jgi:hypothetical protein